MFLSRAVQVDLAGYAPRYLGGHHQPRSRDAHFNDNCVCIALRARSTAFAPDMHEVYKAKWVSSTQVPTFITRLRFHIPLRRSLLPI